MEIVFSFQFSYVKYVESIIIFFDTEYTFKLGKEKSVEYIKT